VVMTQATAPEAIGHPSLARPFFYRFSTGTIRCVVRALTRTRVFGEQHVPGAGPLLVVSNHVQWVDPVILGALFPRPLIFMAKQELWRTGWVGWVVERYGAFPVRRGEADRGAVRRGMSILEAGGAIGIFPEGTRSKSTQLGRAHPGASLLALKSGAPILPVGVSGTLSMGGFGWVGRWPVVDINYGEPFKLDAERAEGKDRLAAGTDLIMRRIAELLPPERRGAYGGPA
jgi:1-acyl-sn-glycerol-3-phosphate acyltransferase